MKFKFAPNFLKKILISLVTLTLVLSIPVQTMAIAPIELFASPPTIALSNRQDFSACFVSDEILVKFKPVTSRKKIDAINKNFGATIVDEIPSLDIYRLKIPGNQVGRFVKKYKESPAVEFVEPNGICKRFIVPNDPLYPNQWALPKVQAELAWDIETGSTTPITIAVLDTGIDFAHPDLMGKTVAGYDFVNDDSYPSDDSTISHGTGVASIAAAKTNNGLGMAGLSWGAKIMPIKVLDDDGGMNFDIASGIMYAADNGANVINLSLGGPDPLLSIEQAITYAQDKGCVIVAAAGNFLEDVPFPYICYPAAYDDVIAVSATNETDGHPGWSNSGSFVDISAPGESVLAALRVATSPDPSLPYQFFSGTSAAAPYVSALAALILSKYPTLTPAEVENAIVQGVDDLGSPGYDIYYGYGRINASKVFKVERIYGSTRYLTAVNISKKGWTTSPSIVITTGENFPDALAGAALAGKYDCPILLTPKTSAPTEVLNEISRLGSTQAYVLGGTGAISDTVVDQLQAYGLSVTRLSGSNRYETATSIANEVGTNSTAIIATGEDFPDALAASNIAANQNIPILLVTKNSIPGTTNQAIFDLGITQTIVVGGFAVISSEVEAQLPNPTRLAGTDRYETAAKIVEYAQLNYGLSWTKPVIATGENFPDALSGSAFASKNGNPLLITSSSSLPGTINSILSANAYSSERVYVLGGTSVISNTVVTQIASIVQ